MEEVIEALNDELTDTCTYDMCVKILNGSSDLVSEDYDLCAELCFDAWWIEYSYQFPGWICLCLLTHSFHWIITLETVLSDREELKKKIEMQNSGFITHWVQAHDEEHKKNPHHGENENIS